MNNFDYTSQNDQQPPIDFNMEPPKPAKNGKGFAIASMSCGILSLLTIGIFAIVLGICGLVFGALVKNAGYSKGYISGMSIAGLVCGIIGVAFSLIWIFSVGSFWLWF